MFAISSKPICFTLALTLVFTTALHAKQTTPTLAPVPPQIAAAHTVFVSNGGGTNYFNQFTGGPDRAYNALYTNLQQSNHYQLVDSPSKADLIFQIRSVAPAVDDGNGGVAYNPQLILSIQDPSTSAVLWTTNANVIAIGTQDRRDRAFDQCVAVVVDKLAQVTGQPLTAAQLKAINANSHWPKSAKIILAIGIAAAGALIGYSIYRITHTPMPTLPPLPNPGFPFPTTH
jgi:hypothetical protein